VAGAPVAFSHGRRWAVDGAPGPGLLRWTERSS